MEKEFWLERWQSNQIGFHQADISPALLAYHDQLKVVAGDRVFVPMCGKSLDMDWLRQQGYRVAGVELSPIAIKDFFAGCQQQPEVTASGEFDLYRAGDIEIWCGDFFKLIPEMLAGVKAVFDRASLIALPVELRKRYAARMAELTDTGTRVLLVTLEYPESEMQGPPFSVTEAEVRDLYENDFGITVLESTDVLAQEPKFQQRGLTQLFEKVYLLQRK